jgi:Tfp pilus assembly ATPase PilU
MWQKGRRSVVKHVRDAVSQTRAQITELLLESDLVTELIRHGDSEHRHQVLRDKSDD